MNFEELLELLPSQAKRIYKELLEVGYNKDYLMSQISAKYKELSPEAFEDDKVRLIYAARLVAVRLARQLRMPTKEFQFIPIGIIDTKISKKGVPIGRMVGLLRTEDNWYPRLIICRDAATRLLDEVVPFRIYKINLYESKDKSLYFATNDTKMEEIQKLDDRPEVIIEFLKKSFGMKIFKLRDVRKYVSRTKEGTNYVDELDIRGIYGFVLRYHSGQRTDGTRYAFYIISDDSVGVKDEVDDEGYVIPSEMTVWVPYRLLKWDVDSELFFYGPVTYNEEDGRASMNALWVIPIHGIPLPEQLE